MIQKITSPIIIFLLALNFLTACSEDGNTDSPSETQNSESLLLTSAQGAILSAAGQLDGASSASLGALAIPSVSCDTNGWPVDDSNNDIYPSTDPNYAFALIYCLGTSNSASPETLYGTMDLASGILCALGTVVYDGSQQSTSYNFSTGSCFSADMSQEMIDSGYSSITLSYTASESAEAGWDYQINMDLSSFDNGTAIFKYKNSDGIVAAAMSETQTNHQSAWMVSIDTTAGDIRFESIDERMDGSNAFNRHSRLLLQCTLDASYNCSNLSNAEGLWSNVHENSGSFYSRMATLSGNPTDGLQTYGYQSNGVASLADLDNAANYSHGSAGFGSDTQNCVSEDSGVCSGNSGLVFVDGALEFLLLRQVGHDGNDGSYPGTWFGLQTTQPTYTSVSTALAQ